MRDPCPHCGLPNVTLPRVDRWTREIVNDIRDHKCPAYATPPALTREPTDTTFMREARNSPEALKSWREYVKRQR
jgi:hypothetical protein